MKNKIHWLLILPLALLLINCGTSSSIATSAGCSGYMVVENNTYKQKFEKKREYKVRHQDKSYLKKKRSLL